MTNPFEVIDRRLSAIEEVLQQLRQQQAYRPSSNFSDTTPIISAAEVKKMTGWPPGTFYAKVASMPAGIVIRNRSKRLLFNRAQLLEWLQPSD
ncbi:hypothetical protein [Spirosoma endophyticum]|uniref:Helix-turn-helix domain-containing protein n=1 Tax=Spirosoma endophyticum TaxID=662367 RepID=A0A1I2GCR2_9BACT|nr:hypothetical protein [Spirosoma endophyticum]SFF15272.1 hypothetical protein SAMN05216167_13133 [Spirosoma endophyticum]